MFGLGVTTVTWHATDGTNASSGCVLVVTVEDDVAPVITLPTIAAQYSTDPDVCTASLTFTATAVDNCDTDPVITYYVGGSTITFPYDFEKGDTEVTVRATDDANKYSEKTFMVKVVDDVDPVFTSCPISPIVATAAGCVNATVEWTPVVAEDNCPGSVGISVLFTNLNTGATSTNYVPSNSNGNNEKDFAVGQHLAVFTATDAAGNSATCEFNIIVHSPSPPTASAQGLERILDENGVATLTIYDTDFDYTGSSVDCKLGSSDPLTNYLSLSQTAFDCSHLGNNDVVLYVTDLSGRVASHTFTVTVRDNQDPVIIPENITVYLDGTTGEVSIDPFDVIDAIIDNCATLTPTLSRDTFTCTDAGQTVSVTITVEDESGNEGTAVAAVTVLDNTPPNLVANNHEVELDEFGLATITFADIYEHIYNDTSFDACGIDTSTLAIDIDAFDCDDVGTPVDVILSVEDVNGNLATATCTVTVLDKLPPVFTPVTDTFRYTTKPTGGDAVGKCYYLVIGDELDPVINDNCDDAPTVTNTFNSLASLDGAQLPVGLTTITWYATDSSGNTSSYTYTIEVEDDELPVFTNFPVNQLRTLGLGACSIGVSWTIPDTDDNCTVASVSYTWETNNTTVSDIYVEPDGADKLRATFHAGITTITYTVIDVNENAYSQSFTVTVFDVNNPTAIAQNHTVYLNAVGVASINPEDVDNNSGDDCGDVFLSVFPNTFGCTNVGTPVEVTLTVTDLSGNTATATAFVTVLDEIDPTIDCVTTTFARENTTDVCGYVTVGNEFDQITYNDNCPGAVLTHDYTGTGVIDNTTLDAAVFPIGTTDVVWTVTDASGNQASCTISITVNDTQVPIVDCATSTFTRENTSGICGYVVVGNEFEPSYVENCPDPVLEYVLTGDTNGTFTGTLAGETFNIGTTTVVFTVTDAAGLSASCTFTVVVEDKEDPVVTCPTTNNPYVADEGECHASLSFTATAVDNCSIATITYSVNGSPISFPYNFPVGTTTVTVVATDIYNNTDECLFTVKVVDDQDPTVLAEDFTAELDGVGMVTVTVNDVYVSSDDNCAVNIGTLRFDRDDYTDTSRNFSCADIGSTITLTLYVDDIHGNTGYDVAEITVVDLVSPVFTFCPADVEVYTATDTCTYTQAGTGWDATADDNCDLVVTPTYTLSGVTTAVTAPNTTLDGQVFEKGVTLVSWKAEDSYGNFTICEFEVTVTDNVFPTIACVTDTYRTTTVSGDPDVPGLCGYQVIGTEFDPLSFNDNCPDAFIYHDYTDPSVTSSNTLAGAIFPVGNTTVEWTVEDASGNKTTCEIVIVVDDKEAPVFTLFPTDKTLSAVDCIQQAGWTRPEFADNCGIDASSLSFTYEKNNTSPLYSIEFTYVPDDPVNYASVSALFPVGTTTITYTASDIYGNEVEQSFTIFVKDATDPVAVVTNTVVYLDNNGYASINPEDVDGGSSDNCGDVVLSVDPFEFSCGDVGAPVPVVLTVADLGGNTVTATAYVTVYDNVFPTIACVTDTHRFNDPTLCTYTVQGTEFDPDVWDNCPNYVVTNDFNHLASLDGAVFDVGDTDVVWTITDASGNAVSCTMKITIEDNEPPTVAVVTDKDRFTDPGECYYTVVGNEFDPASYDDNCVTVSITNDYNSAATLAGAEFGKGIHTVTWTVTDGVGLQTSTTFVVTITDNEPPSIACPTTPFVVDNDPGLCDYTVKDDEFDLDFDDNCPDATIAHNIGTASETHTLKGVVFDIGIHTVVWTVTDAVGLTTSCMATIEIRDGDDPVWDYVWNDTFNYTCGDELVLDGTPCNATFIWRRPGLTDLFDCTEVTITETISNSSVASNVIANYGVYDQNTPNTPEVLLPVGKTVFTYTATDAYGNSAECSFTVTVLDKEDPVITKCPETRNIEGCGTADIDNPAYSTTKVQSDYATFSGFDNKGAANDNCGTIAEVWYSDVIASSDACSVTVNRTWYVYDESGNEATCVQTIIVSDTQAPALTGTPYAGETGIDECKPDINTAAAEFNASLAIEGYTDNCSSVSAILTGTTLTGDHCVWTITYTYEVQDDCGNTLPGQTYTRSGGSLTAPSLVSAYGGLSNVNACKDDAVAAAPFSATNAASGYTAHCGGSVTAALTGTSVTGNDCSWVITYTFRVYDACGNELTGQTYTNTGGYKTAPTLVQEYAGLSGIDSCKPTSAAAEAGFNAASAAAGYSTVCGGQLTASLTNASVSGNDCDWTITYTFKVVDDCGNELTGQTYTDTGGDNTAPTLTGTPYGGQSGVNASITDATTVAPFNPTMAKQGYTDNCSGTNVTAVLTNTDVSGTEFDWTVTYTFKVVDLCDNELLNQSYTNTGGNQDAPELVGTPYGGLSNVDACKAGAVDAAPFDPINALQGYEARCGGPDLTAVLTGTDVSGNDCDWTITYTFKVVDECQNELTGQTYTNTGSNQAAPVLTGNPYPGESGIAGAKPGETEAEDAFKAEMAKLGYADYCGGPVSAVFVDADISGTDCDWTVVYTFKVVDDCGNELPGQTYTDSGGAAIVLVNANIGCSSLNLLDQDLCLAEVAAFDPVALEDDVKALYKDFGVGLDVQWISTTPGANNSDCGWSFIYEFEVSDDCENTETCHVIYTGSDQQAPVFVGPAYVGAAFSVDCEPTPEEIIANYDAYIASALEAYEDNCGGEVFAVFDSYIIQGGTDCLWMVTYHFVVQDICGNVLSGQSFVIHFEPLPPNFYVLSVTISGEGKVEVMGTAYPTPIVVESGTVLITVEEGTVLNLNAIADEGWLFSEWIGHANSSNPTVEITMNESKFVTARFIREAEYVQDVVVDGEECFDSPNTLVVAGDGTTFIVEEGASVQMVAGNNIIFRPGTTIKAGSYLHAYIDPDSPFCGRMEDHFLAIRENGDVEEFTDEVLDADDWKVVENESFFKLYPNPTRDKFTIEFNRMAQNAMITVEVYGMRGERIIYQEVEADQQHTFSLESQHPGIYLVRVFWDGNMQVERILKQN